MKSNKNLSAKNVSADRKKTKYASKKNYLPQKRLIILLITFCFLFLAVFSKLAYVMVAQSKDLTAKAISQWLRDVPTDAPRGQILDRNGIVLADTSTKYTIYVRPNAVTDKEGVAKCLSSILNLDYEKVYKKVTKRTSEATIATGVTKEQMTAIYASGYSGIFYGEDNFRYYPYGDFMTQLLGFTSSDGIGQTGLEAYYENYLKGVNGQILSEADLVGRPIDGNESFYIPSVKGLNLVTTLDYYIQRIAEAAVQKAVMTYDPLGVSCLVMNYKTGEILALAEAPSFDLNNIPRDDVTKLFSMSKSIIVSTVYEPGSTFKILTAASALDANVFTPSSTFYCSGHRTVDGKNIKCWKTRGHGSITFAEGVAQSCNCVFMDSALGLGTEKFYSYLNSFGLTTKTGIDMYGETQAITIAEEKVKSVDLARIGFGQAIACSPIELITATSCVVNGGTTIKPYIGATAIDSVLNKSITINSSYTGNRVISKQTSDTMIELLRGVVEGGSGKGAYRAGYSIIGKTGTAQKYENGKIAQGKYYSSFLGFSVTEGADIAVLFIVNEPKGGVYYGSLVAAPAVGEIFGGIFDYLKIKPNYTEKDYEIIGDEFALNDFVGLSVDEAIKLVKSLGLHYEISGEGDIVTEQFPLKGAKVDKRNTVLFVT
ncbi:MAG: penicillin-binding transpeptidase domain-containing protein, partial [Christensenellales bacterium]